MELETINKLFLELAQITTAKTPREIELEQALKSANELCRSMNCIAMRSGKKTNWVVFSRQLVSGLGEQHRVLMPNLVQLNRE